MANIPLQGNGQFEEQSIPTAKVDSSSVAHGQISDMKHSIFSTLDTEKSMQTISYQIGAANDPASTIADAFRHIGLDASREGWATLLHALAQEKVGWEEGSNMTEAQIDLFRGRPFPEGYKILECRNGFIRFRVNNVSVSMEALFDSVPEVCNDLLLTIDLGRDDPAIKALILKDLGKYVAM